MNKIFTEKEQVTISQFQYDENNELYVGKDVVVETTSGNVRLGYVYEVIDDKETGLQAYVITDSKVVTNKDYETIKKCYDSLPRVKGTKYRYIGRGDN